MTAQKYFSAKIWVNAFAFLLMVAMASPVWAHKACKHHHHGWWGHHKTCHHMHPRMWQPKPEVRWNDVQDFYRPMHNQARLDFCYKDNEYCGRAAANKFCRHHGYRYSTQFDVEHNVGVTSNIYNGRIHTQSCRNGFRFIRCRN